MESSRDIFSRCYDYRHPDQVKEAGVYPYFRAIQETCGRSVTTNGKKRIMIGSNNYLGLTHDPRVIEAGKKALDRYGAGCTGSRFLNGNLDLHEELEDRLAKFLGKERCLVFSTGFLANQGSISCLVGKDDVIISDRENHASIVEGTRVAIGDTIKYRHNDLEDLERVLKSNRGEYKGALIVADGVFSMSGDILLLPEVIALAKKYDCRIYVDDAHALGVLGPKGQGTSQHFGVTQDVDILMGTFSKSFASIGGYVAGTERVINYIQHKARPFMFSAAMPPAAVGSVLECLRILENEPVHLERLRANAAFMSQGLQALGFHTLGSRTPIIPILIGDDHKAFSFSMRLYDEGVFATPVAHPAVPHGAALLRTSYMASHTPEDLNFVLRTLEKLGNEFGIIGSSNRLAQDGLAQVAARHFGVRQSAFVLS